MSGQPLDMRRGPRSVSTSLARAALALSLLGGPFALVAQAQPSPAAPATPAPVAAPPATRPATAARPTSRAAGTVVTLDRVVAVINDAIILESELRARLMLVLPDTASIADPQERARRVQRLTTQTLDEMVNDELMVQAAVTAGIEVGPEEVDAALDEIRTSNKLDDAQLAAELASQGFTITSFKNDLRKQLLRLRAQNQLVAAKVSISEDQLRARYDELARRAESVSSVQLAQMLFKLPEHPTEGDLKSARDRATAAMARVQAGEAFAVVAAELSEDEGTKAGGGEMGWFARGELPGELEQIVFAMDKGELRGPVRVSDGLAVFSATDVKRTTMKPFAEMRDTIRAELRRRETDKQTTQWLADLRKDAYIDLKQAPSSMAAPAAAAPAGTPPTATPIPL